MNSWRRIGRKWKACVQSHEKARTRSERRRRRVKMKEVVEGELRSVCMWW